MVAEACTLSDGIVVIDGQKTDGADSMLKAMRGRVSVEGPISKAHGKLFWINAPAADCFADWEAGPALTEGGFWTAPGVFSADGVDLASALLADALPETLKGEVADLGAGWGYLAAHVLPTLAERAEYPRRELLLSMIGLFLLLGWSIMVLVYYALRDRR